MIIKKVQILEEANECDNLLTELIKDESKYDSNVNSSFVVRDYFKNIFQKEDSAIFIVKDELKTLGYIFIKLKEIDESSETKFEAFIDGLYIKDEYRNKGLATMLLNEAKKWALKKGAKYISLNVLTKNEIAKEFYYKNGFEDFSILLRQKL